MEERNVNKNSHLFVGSGIGGEPTAATTTAAAKKQRARLDNKIKIVAVSTKMLCLDCESSLIYA